MLETHGADLPFNVRKRVNANLKENIAQKIADLIRDGDSIILDSSTTAISVTKYISRYNIYIIYIIVCSCMCICIHKSSKSTII